jgi:haloalkane dehalogenase
MVGIGVAKDGWQCPPNALDRRVWGHLYPFKSHFFDRRGMAYHYLDEGRGPAVIMVHGNPTWSFYYRELVKELRRDHRVIVPDHLGCGLSASPDPGRYGYRLADRVADLEAFMEHLDPIGPLTLVVHDWGGMIGMAWALSHPERIGRVVIFNTAAFPPPTGKPIPRRLQIIRNFAPFSRPAVLGLNLFARAAIYMASRKGLAPEVRAGLLAPYHDPQHRLATLKFVQDIPLAPGDPSYQLVLRTDHELKNLARRPTLICWGRHDFVFDDDYLAEWCRRIPTAEVHVLKDAGHYALEDAAPRVVELVRVFLQKNPI